MSKAEEFIKEYTMGCSNELCAVEDKYGKKVISYHEWLTPEQALRAVEIGGKELIEKAINFLEMLGDGFTIVDNITKSKYDKGQLINDFKKYMKG